MFQGFAHGYVRVDLEQALVFVAAGGEGDDAEGFDGGGHWAPPAVCCGC